MGPSPLNSGETPGSRRSPSAAARAGQRPSPRGGEEGKEQAGSRGNSGAAAPRQRRSARSWGGGRDAATVPPGGAGAPVPWGRPSPSVSGSLRPAAQPVTSALPPAAAAATPGQRDVPSRRLPGSPAPAQWFARTLLAYKRIRAVPFTAKGVRGKEGGGCAAPRRLM